VALTSASGGHAKPVQAMVVVNQFMFSADWGGSIKVRTLFDHRGGESLSLVCLPAAPCPAL